MQWFNIDAGVSNAAWPGKLGKWPTAQTVGQGAWRIPVPSANESGARLKALEGLSGKQATLKRHLVPM
jgi:hypothetical protein